MQKASVRLTPSARQQLMPSGASHDQTHCFFVGDSAGSNDAEASIASRARCSVVLRTSARMAARRSPSILKPTKRLRRAPAPPLRDRMPIRRASQVPSLRCDAFSRHSGSSTSRKRRADRHRSSLQEMPRPYSPPSASFQSTYHPLDFPVSVSKGSIASHRHWTGTQCGLYLNRATSMISTWSSFAL